MSHVPIGSIQTDPPLTKLQQQISSGQCCFGWQRAAQPFKVRFSVPLGDQKLREVNVPYVATIGPETSTEQQNVCFKHAPTHAAVFQLFINVQQ